MVKSKILVVDDDPKLSRLVATILDRVGGYDVFEENRPFAVLATARQFRPDLILLDVDMPGKDGGTISREMAGDVALSKVPVLFVTSLISSSESGTHNGARYLAKPVNPQLLLDTVRGLCPRFQREPQVA
jgi:DNA-binding response OmpR family regulator